MIKLNLPPYDVKLQNKEGKVHIFDTIRKKYLLLTPEEWVRQHFCNFLIKEKGFPAGLISIESGLTYNQRLKRTDVVVRDTLLKPLILVECKAPEIRINDAVINQITTYYREIQAKFMIVTNGLEHYCFEVKKGELNFLDKIPDYANLV